MDPSLPWRRSSVRRALAPTGRVATQVRSCPPFGGEETADVVVLSADLAWLQHRQTHREPLLWFNIDGPGGAGVSDERVGDVTTR